MKKQNLLPALCVLAALLWACSSPSGGGDPPGPDGPEAPTARVRFVNDNEFKVSLYGDQSRTVKVAEAGPKAASPEVSVAANPQGVLFYPVYHLALPGLTVPYDGEVIIARIEGEKTNAVTVPLLSQLDVAERSKPVGGGAYLRIQNSSSFSLTLRRGSSEERPLDSASSIMNSGESARYLINAGPASLYSVRKNTTDFLSFPPALTEFAPGHFYSLAYDGASLSPVTDYAVTIQKALEQFLAPPAEVRPWILVKQGGSIIDLYGEYNCGSVLPNTVTDSAFTIENIGEGNLVIDLVNGSRVTLDENASGFFGVTQQPLAGTLAPGGKISFTVRFNPTAGGTNITASVRIKTNSKNVEEFAFRIRGNAYAIGDAGPGGGTVFFAQGNSFLECSGELGSYDWNMAKTKAQSFRGGGFSNWHLPDRGELDLMYKNLHLNGWGGFGNGLYWSSTGGYGSASYQDFSDGTQIDTGVISFAHSVRAVRAF